MNEALLAGVAPADSDTGPEGISLGEGRMVREDCWREVHRLYHVERRSKSEIARQVELDRKTVRGILAGARLAALHAHRAGRYPARRPRRLSAEPGTGGAVLGADLVPGVAPRAALPG